MSEIDDVLSNRKSWAFVCADVLDGLRSLPGGCVHCCVTSPPYFGLRDYKTACWIDGDEKCDHVSNRGKQGDRADRTHTGRVVFKDICGKCGAIRKDFQIGLEQTPQAFVARLVEVFREVRRVLREDGTLWINIGDSYANDGKWGGHTGGKHAAALHNSPVGRSKRYTGLKPKDMIGVPWMLAFALRDDGWYLRSEVIWRKPGPMPESTRDRPTKSHEAVFLLAKKPRYFYDVVRSAEQSVSGRGNKGKRSENHQDGRSGFATNAPTEAADTRQMRDVWSIATEPFKQAHFATFPTALVRKCLSAGISERGVCPACGAPWKRLTTKERVATRPGDNTKVRIPAGWNSGPGSHGTIDGNYRDANEVGNRDPQRHVTRTVTTGWEPTCSCNTGEPIPPLVLDPFGGAATTTVQARRMGSRAIAFDLNPEYVAIGCRRVEEDPAKQADKAARLAGRRPAKPTPMERTLFDAIEVYP